MSFHPTPDQLPFSASTLLCGTTWNPRNKVSGCTGHKAVLPLPVIQQCQGGPVSSPPWWQPATSCSWSTHLAWHKAPGCPAVFSFGASSSSVPSLHVVISSCSQKSRLPIVLWLQTLCQLWRRGNNQERPTTLVGVTPEIVLPGSSFRINTLKVAVMSVSAKPNEQHKNECGHNLVSITHNVSDQSPSSWIAMIMCHYSQWFQQLSTMRVHSSSTICSNNYTKNLCPKLFFAFLEAMARFIHDDSWHSWDMVLNGLESPNHKCIVGLMSYIVTI